MKFQNQIEYQIEYGMRNYRNVSIYPKILETKKRFSKEEKEYLTRPGFRWYVYYSFRNPAGKFIRQKPTYGSLNRDYPDFDGRYQNIFLMKEALLIKLKSGYNPYNKKETPEYSLVSALEFALDKKGNEVGTRTMDSYKIAVKQFKEWLKDNGYEYLPVFKIDKKILNLFLNHIAKTKSNRSRNNYKNSLSAIFTKLVDFDYLDKNILINISDLPAEPKRDPTWSDKQVEDVDTYLEKTDPVLLMFIHFVDYLFWRPKENCRLQVKDINLDQRLISVKTKTKGTKTKIIPDIIYNELAAYIKDAEPEFLLFTPTGPGLWERQLDGRRAVFTNRFAKVKKEIGLPKEYTIYGRRHTAVTKVYKNLRKNHSKERSLDMLSQITGHTSNAIKAYIHYIDAEISTDYSHLFK